MADNTKKKKLRWVSSENFHARSIETTSAENNIITIVLKKVARFELIPCTPIFPKIAVNAAKTADNNAKKRQSLNIFTSLLKFQLEIYQNTIK
jgi:tartrate dehydratase alpha subunit/fumarate hydratase class I-like protein